MQCGLTGGYATIFSGMDFIGFRFRCCSGIACQECRWTRRNFGLRTTALGTEESLTVLWEQIPKSRCFDQGNMKEASVSHCENHVPGSQGPFFTFSWPAHRIKHQKTLLCKQISFLTFDTKLPNWPQLIFQEGFVHHTHRWQGRTHGCDIGRNCSEISRHTFPKKRGWSQCLV